MVKLLLVLAILATAVSIGFAVPKPGDFEKFKQIPGLDKFKEEDLKRIFENGPQIREWLMTLTDSNRPRRSSSPKISWFCETCKATVDALLAILEAGGDPGSEFEAITVACTVLNLATDSECQAMVDQNAPGVQYIIENAVNPAELSGSDICAVLDQASNDCGSVQEVNSNWAVALPGPKPPVEERPILPVGHPTAPILQITDVHLDLKYVEGSWANCDSNFLCCRTAPPEGASEVELAGPWGAYHCDAPVAAVSNAISEAAAKYSNYEFVMLTGDFIHHVMPEQTKQDTLDHNTKVAQLMLQAFPTTKVYPVIGNHDSAPTNQFPPASVWNQGHDVSWVYENIATLFATQLPGDALTTLRRGGYYSVVHKPGLRLIVLNTNFGYIYNFWLFYKFQDPEGQLDWLAKTLSLAAAAKESVYILGHEPMGSDMWNPWTQQYVNIINHYQGIIRAQFYGHTHWDELRLTFDSESMPTSVLYVGPSVTPFWDVNPAFKVYHVDGAGATAENTWEVLDHEIHSFDLSKVGANNPPVWSKLESARETYNLTNLRPAAYMDLFKRMVNDNELFDKFYNNYVRNGERSPVCDDDECRLSILCQQVTAVWEDQSHCEYLRSLLEDDSGSGQILPHGLLLLAVVFVSLVINTRF